MHAIAIRTFLSTKSRELTDNNITIGRFFINLPIVFMNKDLIICDSLDDIGKGEVSLHLAHILCLDGHCDIRFNGKDFRISRQDCCIIRATQLIEALDASEDFRVKVIYASPVFIEKSTPNTNYGMRGSLSLSQNPVMPLNEEEFSRCRLDFEAVESRLADTGHRFYEETLFSVMRTLILDFFDFHIRINAPREKHSSPGVHIMGKFISMLERGDYRRIRTVSHYASELCVTPKHLSEISRSITGFSSGWWINRFTTLDISRQLRDRSQNICEIAERFNFTSLSYFTRYVSRHIGQSPSDYRK